MAQTEDLARILMDVNSIAVLGASIETQRRSHKFVMHLKSMVREVVHMDLSTSESREWRVVPALSQFSGRWMLRACPGNPERSCPSWIQQYLLGQRLSGRKKK